MAVNMVNIVWEDGEIHFVPVEFLWHQNRMYFVMPDGQDRKVSASRGSCFCIE